jgi:hypothetical protein
LLNWYNGGGANAPVENITVRGVGGAAKPAIISDIEAHNMGRSEDPVTRKIKPDYISLRATVIFIRHDFGTPPYYMACQGPAPQGQATITCNKKYQDGNQGTEGCAVHGTQYPAAPKYIFSCLCADFSGSTWTNAFNEIGEVSSSPIS